MQIEIYLMHLNCFSNFYSLLYLLLIVIDHQSQHFSERKPERNWNFCEASSSTNDYCEQCDISYDQPANHNQRQKYRHDITTQQAPYRNDHDRGELKKYGSIYSVLPSPQ